uniref:Uncharacterized protein n=1 Tax=Tanacetum cinerariifolium TaxID=118510 RepID=A0A6L2NQN0_TANCI|nr:hypothetical protein [Tanacetum cinerariifolium]
MADGKKASNGAHCKSCDRNLRTEGGLQDHNQAKQADFVGERKKCHTIILSFNFGRGILGCEALVKQDTLNKLDKLKPRSINCIFVRYLKETTHYSFYYLFKKKVIVAQNANFLENSLINKEASGSLEDFEIIQEEDTHPSIDTSLHHEEDDLEMDEPQINIIPIHRSTRIRHALDRMCLYINAKEHELKDLVEPTNYKATLLDLKFNKWLDAINVEMQSMKDNAVWDLVKLHPDRKTIGRKWLFKKKTDMDRAVHTYKARLMEKVYTQTPRMDYEETFSPISKIRAIRILIAVCTFYYYEIWNTKDMFLIYGGDIKRELKVSCYTNAGYLMDVDDLKSQTGYAFILNGGAVDWKSAKQKHFRYFICRR